MRRFLGADVQVLRHAMKKVGSGMRAWHGRMYLFPDEMHNDDGQTAASVFLEPRSGEQREGSYWRGLKATVTRDHFNSVGCSRPCACNGAPKISCKSASCPTRRWATVTTATPRTTSALGA